jgi:hypothetical protein
MNKKGTKRIILEGTLYIWCNTIKSKKRNKKLDDEEQDVFY